MQYSKPAQRGGIDTPHTHKPFQAVNAQALLGQLASVWSKAKLSCDFFQAHKVTDVDAGFVWQAVVCRIQVNHGCRTSGQGEIVLQPLATGRFAATRWAHHHLPKCHGAWTPEAVLRVMSVT